MPGIQLAAQEASGHDPRTDHLRPVIEHLLAQGNRPAHWWHAENGPRSRSRLNDSQTPARLTFVLLYPTIFVN